MDRGRGWVGGEVWGFQTTGCVACAKGQGGLKSLRFFGTYYLLIQAHVLASPRSNIRRFFVCVCVRVKDGDALQIRDQAMRQLSLGIDCQKQKANPNQLLSVVHRNQHSFQYLGLNLGKVFEMSKYSIHGKVNFSSTIACNIDILNARCY